MTIDQKAIVVDEKIDTNTDTIADDLLLDPAHLDAIDDATLTRIASMSITVAVVDIDTITVAAIDTIALIIIVEAEEEM